MNTFVGVIRYHLLKCANKKTFFGSSFFGKLSRNKNELLNHSKSEQCTILSYLTHLIVLLNRPRLHFILQHFGSKAILVISSSSCFNFFAVRSSCHMDSKFSSRLNFLLSYDFLPMKIDSEILQHISSADLAPVVAKHILRLILHICKWTKVISQKVTSSSRHYRKNRKYRNNWPLFQALYHQLHRD